MFPRLPGIEHMPDLCQIHRDMDIETRRSEQRGDLVLLLDVLSHQLGVGPILVQIEQRAADVLVLEQLPRAVQSIFGRRACDISAGKPGTCARSLHQPLHSFGPRQRDYDGLPGAPYH
jgi:hypothetical protein